MTVPSRPPWTLGFRSPFQGARSDEVAKVVRSGYKGTRLNREYCAVLDERSLRDRTAIIARIKEEDPKNGNMSIIRVRQPFNEVNAILEASSIGEGSLEELIANGAEEV